MYVVLAIGVHKSFPGSILVRIFEILYAKFVNSSNWHLSSAFWRALFQTMGNQQRTKQTSSLVLMGFIVQKNT